MINDESNKCYYFAVINFSELNSLGWVRGKKIIIMIMIMITLFKML